MYFFAGFFLESHRVLDQTQGSGVVFPLTLQKTLLCFLFRWPSSNFRTLPETNPFITQHQHHHMEGNLTYIVGHLRLCEVVEVGWM